jgi:hypothetical protein
VPGRHGSKISEQQFYTRTPGNNPYLVNYHVEPLGETTVPPDLGAAENRAFEANIRQNVRDQIFYTSERNDGHENRFCRNGIFEHCAGNCAHFVVRGDHFYWSAGRTFIWPRRAPLRVHGLGFRNARDARGISDPGSRPPAKRSDSGKLRSVGKLASDNAIRLILGTIKMVSLIPACIADCRLICWLADHISRQLALGSNDHEFSHNQFNRVRVRCRSRADRFVAWCGSATGVSGLIWERPAG